MEFKILYETEFLLIVDKPHGWLTTPAREKSDPRPCLGRELQARLKRQIFPVHRLDFEVSGLTAWAMDENSHRLAQRWFEDMMIDKTYEAFSEPTQPLPPLNATAEWRSNLAKGKRRAFAADHGRPSLTKARLVEAESRLWKWELSPVTGRPHQLRFEMANHGHPIVGDVLYGGRALPPENWIALRATQLDLKRIPQANRLGLPENCRTDGLSFPSDL